MFVILYVINGVEDTTALVGYCNFGAKTAEVPSVGKDA